MKVFAVGIKGVNNFKVVHAQTKASVLKIVLTSLIKSGVKVGKINILNIGENKFAKKGIIFEMKGVDMTQGIKKYHEFVNEVFNY